MSLQPSDAAADAFERLRSEVALLRRAVEGLAADGAAPQVDYSPTLAEMSDAIHEVSAKTSALGERPLLALAPDQLGSLFQIAAAKVLARPVAELERERGVLRQAMDALGAARQAEAARVRSRQRAASLIGGGALAGIVLWTLALGPLARALPPAWAAPERLAAATLDLPMVAAGETLLRRGDPARWEAVNVARRLPASEVAALRDCMSDAAGRGRKSCTVKLKAQ